MPRTRCHHDADPLSCEACYAEDAGCALAPPPPTLAAELAHLEATDPAVRAAAADWDRTVRRILRRRRGGESPGQSS